MSADKMNNDTKRDELQQAKYERDGFMILSMVCIVIGLFFVLLFFSVLEQRNQWRDEAYENHKKHIEEIQRDTRCLIERMKEY